VILTAAQVREKRRLLGWTVSALATQGVDASHLEGFERGRRRLSVLNLSVIQRTLEAAGVEFIAKNGGGAGVRRRQWSLSRAALKSRDLTLPHRSNGDKVRPSTTRC
jgi:transcriptional regulator with XRE-family HTH domain